MSLPVIGLALFTGGYLLGLLEDTPAPDSGDYVGSYQAPFSGGQCPNTEYKIQFILDFQQGQTAYFVENIGYSDTPFSDEVVHSSSPFDSGTGITGASLVRCQFNGCYLALNQVDTNVFLGNYLQLGNLPVSVSIYKIIGADCGDLSDPNPTAPTASSGVASGGFSPNAGLTPVIAAAPIALIPSFAAGMAALLAAAKVAAAIGQIADAIGNIADAMAELLDLLDRLKDFLDDKEKEEDENKDVLSHNFGIIARDGFLRLYPTTAFDDTECIELNVVFTAIPINSGRYFGSRSPNFFEYKRLGYIAFVSGSFGVMEKHYLQFQRSSISVPDGAIGFFYHLGLDGNTKANAIATYLKEQ